MPKAPSPAADLLAFTPVPRQRMRRGGWSADRQRQFIALLAETGSVRAACRRLGVGEHHIYKLRGHPEAASFRAAWEAALDCGIARIEDTAMDRALYGVEAPVFYQGEKVGSRQVYNDRLLMFLLNNRAPHRFARGTNGQITGLARSGPSPAELKRLKTQWRKEWEAEQHAGERNVSAAEVRASIDRKIEEVRRRVDAERAAIWERLSPETRAAWAHFVATRDRDLAAMKASPAARKAADVEWNTDADAFERPPPPRQLLGPRVDWSLKDDNFDP